MLSIRGTASPIAFEGLIFTSFSNGRLAAVREVDGIQLWEKPISRLKGSTELEKLMDADSVAIPINEDVFAANYNGSLTRFNIRGGDKIFSVDPFVSIDEGVADLVEIAVEKGKSQNKKLKLGICGEHGGDPMSIHFCSKAGLNYVSCSPYRVPIARLAAAQAELKKQIY